MKRTQQRFCWFGWYRNY